MRGKRAIKFSFAALGCLIAVGAFYRFYDPMPDIPMPVREAKHADTYADFMAEIEKMDLYSLSEVELLDPKKRNAESIKRGREFVRKQESVLARLDSILEKPFDAPLLTRHPTTEISGKAKSAGIHMGAKGILALTDGNSNEAYRWCFASWQLGANWHMIGAFEIETLVAHGIMSRARNYIIQCTEKGPPSDSKKYIAMLESHLERTPDVPALIHRERDEFVSRWLTKMKNRNWLAPDEPSEYPLPEPSFMDKWRLGNIKKRDFIAKGLARRDEAEKIIPRFYSRKTISFTDLGPTGDLASGLLDDEFAPILILSFATDCTGNSLLLTYLGLEEFRRSHGNYPDSLEQLTPKILKSIPRDPFNDGKPLKYSRTKTGFQLYSIGPDMVDDHAAPIFRSFSYGKNYGVIRDDSKGDIVWGINKI